MWTGQDIGETAGRVWQFLHQNGTSSLSAVNRGTEAPEPLVLMAVGWLAREGKINLRREGRTVRLWLTES